MRISDWSSDVCSSDLEALRASGRVYPAYETAQELDLKRKIQLGRGLPPIYDRAALGLSDADRARFEAEGIKPHWRFRLDHDSARSEENTSELPSLMRISYAVLCLKKKTNHESEAPQHEPHTPNTHT